MSKTLKILLTIVIALGGVTVLAYQSVGDVEYYVHVDELVKNPDEWLDKKTIQVHGFAQRVPAKGTIVGQSVWREFELESQGKVMAVRHEGVVPDTFKEAAETVVKGRVVREGDRLVLTTVGGEQGILAKCPSKYQGAR